MLFIRLNVCIIAEKHNNFKNNKTMRGSAVLLSSFIEGNKVQFIVPVYQRNYDWLTENCNQLYNDLVKLCESGNAVHFFGSIVTSSADGYGYNRLVIDGQQRLTTISLLLLAGIKAVKDGKLSVSNDSRIEEAYDLFLRAKYATVERKIKLVPIENDLKAYDRIYHADEEHFIEESKITKNYRHFYNLLTKTPQVMSFDDLLNSIEKLQIITIELDSNDDAQLIFESLNSTGLALTEADKIRNYMLMSLSADEQQYCFKEYWEKIEFVTDNKPTMFMRDYLTIKQQMQHPIRLSNIYFEWKKYMYNRDRKNEFIQMIDYAAYYKQVTKAQLATKKLSEKMSHLCNIETDVINVFLIQFLKYAYENSLSEDEIYKVLDIVENYMARRIICNFPSSALTQVFCVLHKDVLKSIEEYNSVGKQLNYSYSQILIYHVMRRDGNYQLPRDIQFIEAIKTRDAYHMAKPFQIFLFERLENNVQGEYNDVVSDMKSKNATIEHIMPQTLSDKWIAMLGDNYKNIQEKYLHTFANLTLTGINSKLGNKIFNIKRDGDKTEDGKIVPGYKNSKYRLTRSVTNCDNWTNIELEKRGQEIVDIFLTLYPLPSSFFKPLPKPVEEVELSEETFSPTNRILRGFRLFDKEYVETTWKGMLLQVVSIISELFPDTVDTLYDAECFFWTSASANIDINYCTQLAQDKYLWTNMDNNGKIRCLRYLFEKCDVPESVLVFILEPVKDRLDP